MAAGSAGISLHLSDQMLVAGETVQGEVQLDYPLLEANGIQEVIVRISGSVNVLNLNGPDDGTPRTYDSHSLYHQEIPVWRKGATAQTKNRFTFRLPLDLPPSFQVDGLFMDGRVGHLLEVIGKRTDTANYRIVKPLSVVSPDLIGAHHRQTLQQGWNGPWVPIKKEAHVRKGLWGSHATVQMELRLPGISPLPLFTRIPFVLSIVTFTKEMKSEETSKGPYRESIFPTPPSRPQDISFWLRRRIEGTIHGRTVEEDIDYMRLGGLGEASPSNDPQPEVRLLDKQWIPSPESRRKGVWRQETEIHSSLTLQCTPTFSYPTLKLKYFMSLEVNFPGVGNTVKMAVPVEIGSGMTSRPQAERRRHRRRRSFDPVPAYSEVDESLQADERRSTLDLPPSYWSIGAWETDT